VDADSAIALVNRIYERLAGRRFDVEKREDYYAGKQPLSFATDEWRKANAARYSGFSDNWTRPVVDAEAERIRHTGIKIGDDASAGRLLWEQWLLNEMEMQSSQGFVTSLVASRSFVIVWGDSQTDEPRISWEHPNSVEIEYDWENPNLRRAALKTWVDENSEYATLYTPEWVWKFERPRSLSVTERESQAEQARVRGWTAGGWVPRESATEPWPLRNPIGVVPVVEIKNRPILGGDPISEISGVIPMQDAINLLWAYAFLAADYASMPARVVLGQAPPKIPILDSNGQKIGEKPVDLRDLSEKRLLYLTGENAKIDSWEAARLDVFTDTIEVAVGHIAAQTRTPPTYLVTKTGMSNVNGEGLKASEIGLVKKVEEFQTFASPALRELYRLVALAMGDEALARQARLAKIDWANPEIRSDAQLSDSLLKLKAMGYPLEFLMELRGDSPLEIERIMGMARAEQDALVGFGIQSALVAEAAEAVVPSDVVV
jgi:hypothetical protein